MSSEGQQEAKVEEGTTAAEGPQLHQSEVERKVECEDPEDEEKGRLLDENKGEGILFKTSRGAWVRTKVRAVQTPENWWEKAVRTVRVEASPRVTTTSWPRSA